MKTKTMPASYAPDDGAGFEAIVSVFNNKDLVGDIVRPGAFTDSIEYWKSIGDPMPVLWSHRMDDPNYNIGSVVDMAELGAFDKRIPEWAPEHVKSNGGLWVKAELDTDGVAGQVRNLLTKRRVRQFSFSYEVVDEKLTKAGNELLKLFVHEVGPTPVGANPLTVLAGAKAADPPDDPPDTEPDTKRRPSALFLRLQCDIAALEHEHTH